MWAILWLHSFGKLSYQQSSNFLGDARFEDAPAVGLRCFLFDLCLMFLDVRTHPVLPDEHCSRHDDKNRSDAYQCTQPDLHLLPSGAPVSRPLPLLGPDSRASLTCSPLGMLLRFPSPIGIPACTMPTNRRFTLFHDWQRTTTGTKSCHPRFPKRCCLSFRTHNRFE